jgi:hypothetical protein
VKGKLGNAWTIGICTHALGMRQLGCGVEFPHWDLPQVHVIFIEVDLTSVELAQASSQLGT